MTGPAVIAKLSAQPGRRDELLAGLQSLLEAVDRESGTIEYIVHLDAGDADVVWVYERYDSQDAFDAHSSSDTMKAVGMALRDIAAGRPELTMLTPVAGKGL